MSNGRTRGFTLIEIVVVFAIIAILAAVLTPLVSNYVEEARITRASAEVKAIADAIGNFNKNTARWPIFKSGLNITTLSEIYTALGTDGTDPQCVESECACGCTSWLPAVEDARGFIADILERNTPAYSTSGKFAWRGPYLTDTQEDPWGNAYLVNADSLKYGVNRAGFVLSAGPNGKIETKFSQNIGSGSGLVTTGGDDIVARLR